MGAIRLIPVTVAIGLLSVALFYGLGAGTFPFQNWPTLNSFGNVFRHGTPEHLAGNIFFLGLGGCMVEPKIPQKVYLGLIAVLIVVPTLVQLILVDAHFLGLSGVCYGICIYGLMLNAPKERAIGLMLFAFLLVMLEIAFRSGELAVYTHLTGILIGGSAVMFQKFLPSKGPQLRKMEFRHIVEAIAIINETDEDDASEAESSFLDDGLENMFVLVERGSVLGLTGYSLDEDADGVAWLSWTYLRDDSTGQGWGAHMMNDMLGRLNKLGVRKIFIDTSDYSTNFGKQIYAGAHKLYKSFGAKLELTVKDYFGPNDSKLVFGLDNPEYNTPQDRAKFSEAGCALVGIVPAPESDGGLALLWEENEGGLAGIGPLMDKARTEKARIVVLSLPQDISDGVSVQLKNNGFEQAGGLKDYYSLGLHQVWWACDMSEQSNVVKR
ncbi:MAG: rhomboid family intramembrane serine protease [Marinosulfonomonas sp.]|nr:rhomboid family intramembrane serine protease [Marinosulfonomonas sp.]